MVLAGRARPGATIAATVTYLLPVVAIVLGGLALGERATAVSLGGIVLVLARVALTRPRAAAKAAAARPVQAD